jgi:DsbC/DsbD-like thiol-disulfide interchange protein
MQVISLHHRLTRLFFPVLLGAMLAGPAAAQLGQDLAQGDKVDWSVPAQDVAKGTGRAVLTLNGAVQPGWHVYSLKQLPNGPTSLIVKLEANNVASSGGAVQGTAPTKYHDPAFGLETQFYDSAFAIKIPVRFKPNIAPGAQTIPLSVRFQTCNGGICQPPKTVQLSATVNVGAGN